MSLVTAILYLLVGIAGVAAVLILFSKEVFNAAILLLVCLLAIAGLYVLLNAEFIAVVQIMVYAGGILLLVMFGIMLTSKVAPTFRDTRSFTFYMSVLLGVALCSLLWMTLEKPQLPEFNTNPPTTTSIGMELITSYSAPFELAGILLLISLITAMTIASYRKPTARQ